MKKLISIIAGVSLSLISGCSFLDNLPPNFPPNPEITPILPKTEVPYDEIKQRAKIVANSLEKHFPEGVVIYLKKDKRYVVLNVLKEERDSVLDILNKARTLGMTIYRLESPIKENLEKYFIREQDETKTLYRINAAEILAQSDYSSMAIFYDRGTNGLKEGKGDSLKTRTQGKGEIIFKEGKLISENEISQEDGLNDFLKNANFLYLDYLKRLTSK